MLPLLLLALAAPASAQNINETFTSTAFPPGGWATFETGGGSTPWIRGGTAGQGFALAQFEPASGGVNDIDWLVTPNLAPAAGTSSLTFKMWQSYGTNYGDIYRILVSTTSQTDPAAFTQVAQWNEITACPGGTGAPPAARPTASNCTLNLSAYAGQTVYVAFQHETDDGDNFNLDDVAGVPLNLGPAAIAVSPGGVNLGAAGPCTGLSRSVTVAVQNSGSGTVNVTAATLSGSSAFTLGTPAPTFPAALTFGGTFNVPIVFNPAAGQTGPQNGTLTITYNLNGGASMTTTVALSGTSDAEGAGYVFRGASATAACTNGAAAPGTSFVDITGHTQLITPTSGSLDDGFFALDLTTAVPSFGSVRILGQNRSSLFVTTNNSVILEGGIPNFYGGPTAGVSTLQVGAMDLDIGDFFRTGAPTGTPAELYDTADPGQFPVGIYYGLSNVDGVPGDELVITWYHNYDFGSQGYDNAAARYFTSQLIIYKGRANEEARFEMRFPDGVDGAGVPFRRNTAVAGGIDSDAAVLIGEALAGESAIYLLGTTGFGAGTLYPATGGNGVRFDPEAQSIAMGQAGWRMMGAPVRAFTVGRLAEMNLVQSVTGQYPDFEADNLYTDYDGTSTGSGYVPATSVANVLDPGQGFIWYLFNQDITPNPANDGGGTSRSYTLPMLLEATGAEPVVTGGGVSVPLVTTGGGFNLVANPFRDDLDVSTLGSWATGGTLLSGVPQVWDPNVGASGSYVTVSGSVSTWQGFFIQNNTATTLNVPTNARNTTGTFLGRDGSLYSDGAGRLAFELSGTNAAGGTTIDRAATLVVSETAVDGWDLLDASKLAPLANAYATLAFQGELGGEPNLKAQESRPAAATAFDIPLVVDAVGTAPSLTLSWDGLDALPATWAVELRDLVTGVRVDLRAQTSYAFDQAAEPARDLAPATLLGRTTVAAQAKAGSTPRFVLHVTTGRTTATEGDAVTEFALAAPAPNPTAGAARVAFALPTASDVTVVLYDLLGRRVATLAEGQMAAGRHEARLDAGALAPGVYVVRMQAGTFAATQRVTVVR